MYKKTRRRDYRPVRKKPDAQGRHTIFPYIPGETDMDRHIRRLRFNLEHKPEVEAWCAEHGWQLEVSEEGHYWDFRRGGTYCQWRPKFKQWFVSRRPVAGKEVFDYQQAIAMLETYTKE